MSAKPDDPPSTSELRVGTPGTTAPLRVTLRDGEALLLGRDPDAAALPEDALAVGALRTLAVPGATVSGTHALVWRTPERTSVRDLQSRNGTWLLVPPGATASIATAAAGELSLELARPAMSALAARPRDAEWASEEEFAGAVVREVNRWLALGAAGLTARLVRRDGRDNELIPLGAAWGIHLVEPDGALTVSVSWEQVLEPLLRYVHDQEARLLAERSLDHDASFVMASPAFWAAHRRVVEACAGGLRLVMLGETGVGKGTLARCYHRHSERARGPFESVNCAELDRHFARTRLFGARRGAYTGCVADVAGSVECARGGTLFLDEVAELGLDVQGELLSFLDDGRYKRMGDPEWRQADVRVVCGTNVDLRRAVADGRFRGDLWYRLAGRVVTVAPLRDRPEDVTAMLRARTTGERPDAVSVWDALSPAARRAVLAHPWHGNFRELDAFARRLPPAFAAESVDEGQCRGALAEGALEPRRPEGDPWGRLLDDATRAWHGLRGAGAPARSADFKEYVEDVLKPMFFAQTLGFESAEALPERPSPSYEEMARRMGCDAATVKNQLTRYLELRRGRGG